MQNQISAAVRQPRPAFLLNKLAAGKRCGDLQRLIQRRFLSDKRRSQSVLPLEGILSLSAVCLQHSRIGKVCQWQGVCIAVHLRIPHLRTGGFIAIAPFCGVEHIPYAENGIQQRRSPVIAQIAVIDVADHPQGTQQAEGFLIRQRAVMRYRRIAQRKAVICVAGGGIFDTVKTVVSERLLRPHQRLAPLQKSGISLLLLKAKLPVKAVELMDRAACHFRRNRTEQHRRQHAHPPQTQSRFFRSARQPGRTHHRRRINGEQRQRNADIAGKGNRRHKRAYCQHTAEEQCGNQRRYYRDTLWTGKYPRGTVHQHKHQHKAVAAGKPGRRLEDMPDHIQIIDKSAYRQKQHENTGGPLFPSSDFPVKKPQREQQQRQHPAVQVRRTAVRRGIEGAERQFSRQRQRIAGQREVQLQSMHRFITVTQGENRRQQQKCGQTGGKTSTGHEAAEVPERFPARDTPHQQYTEKTQ